MLNQVAEQHIQRVQLKLTKIAKKRLGNTVTVSIHYNQYRGYSSGNVHVWKGSDIIHSHCAQATFKQIINWINGL